MTNLPPTHPYRYTVWFTYDDGAEQSKEMAFQSPKTITAIQALDDSITVTRVEVSS